jgi:hypothetical protein
MIVNQKAVLMRNSIALPSLFEARRLVSPLFFLLERAL